MELRQLLQHYFGLTATEIRELAGETDRNYYVEANQAGPYLLKLADPAHFDPVPVLTHLATKTLPFRVPQLVAQHTVDISLGKRRATLQTWVPGRLLATIRPTPTLWQSWGRTCGQLTEALSDLALPSVHRRYGWDPVYAAEVRKDANLLDNKQKKLTEYFLDRQDRADYSALRQSVNYNDAHEHNLLVGPDGTICGVIDFGDTVYTATVCELAIACAYAGVQLPDPLAAWRTLVGAYHAIHPLQPNELVALFDLICGRLLLTVTTAARNRLVHPDNAYLSVSERSAWELLARLRTINPTLAEAHFRVAAGLSAHRSWQDYHDWAEQQQTESLLPLSTSRLIPLDLGVGSPTLGANANFEHLPTFVTHVRRHLEDQHADIAVGGYGETRPVYTTDAFRTTGNQGPRWRTVHLGLDFWTRRAGDAILCPLTGTVVTCGTDPTPGGYGSTIILRHTPTPTLTFYTLYGHLGARSIKQLRAGTQVQGEQLLATIGAEDENGGWPPHLHFQVMLDLLGNSVDFPGVAYSEERDVWLGLCPNPRTLLPVPVPNECTSVTDYQDLPQRRAAALGYSLSVSYNRPLTILRGARQYLYDHTGRRYLDTVNNVAHVGHEHPRVVAAARGQLSVLNTNSRYLHPTVVAFAEALTATLSPSLSVVHFVNSGSEANELALRMAEAVTGSRKVLALEMGYHGNTSRTIEVSSYKFDRHGGAGRPPHTHLLPLPDSLRGRHLDPTPHLPEGTTTFIHESIPSCGGQLVLPPGYLARVYDHVRADRGICIADEVQTGLGRVGTHYWAFETQGVVPDIVTIGKPLGNGHPLGAVVCTPAVARAFANGMEYFNTFGGNPVSAAVGLEVLRIVVDEGLQEHARLAGDYLKGSLRQLADRHPVIIEVRGSGLFLGVEFGTPDLAPAAPPADYVMNRMRELGFLMGTDGPHHNVLKIKPPLCFTREDADLLVEYLDRVLSEDGSRLADE